MSNSTTTVKIPASVTHDHAYAYGYLTSSLALLGWLADKTDPTNKYDLAYLRDRIMQEAKKACELDAEINRRADERIRELTKN